MIRRGLVVLGLVCAIAFAPSASAGATLAMPQIRQFAACSQSVPEFLGLEPWWSCLKAKYDGEIRIGTLNDIWLVVLVILEDAIKIGAYVAVGMIIWGGIKYSKSMGNPSELQQAQAIIKNSILGLVITLISVAIVQFIVRGLATPA
ncbi:MAG TPA: hypothetical protein VFT87_01645 [Candidatus Saccharimonadales bacterium]|nr:hypothetical protein [Candidatus Saccharimonadales bacterium]